MIRVNDKCAACGKFVVPEEHRHLVKVGQADRVCKCARVAPAPAPVMVERVVVKESFWVKAIAIGLLLAGAGWFISNQIAKHEAEEAAIRRAAFRLMDVGYSKENAIRTVRELRNLDKDF